MPSVLKSAISYQLSAISLILFFVTYFLLLTPSPAFAAQGDTCTFSDQCNLTSDQGGGNGQRPCPGTWQPLSPSNPELTCQPDGGSTAPAPAPSTIQPPSGNTTTPVPSVVPNPLVPNKDNWTAVAQSTYTWDNTLCSALTLLAGGCPYKGQQPGRFYDPATGDVSLLMFDKAPGGGALGSVTTVLAGLYNPPTSTVQYLASIGQNFGFATPVYAQTRDVPGSGAGIIGPIRMLWQAVRNIAYLAFILVFLVVGFMVMFRQKISQQVVVTAQMALPGLVVGLLLVTFSYFIAALAIDLSFVGVPLITRVLSQSGLPNDYGNPAKLEELSRNSSVFEMFGTAAGRFTKTSNDLGKTIWNTGNFNDTNTYLAGTGILTVAGAIIGTLIAPGVGTLIGGGAGLVGGPFAVTSILSLVIPVVLTIALFIQMLRLFFALISTYIQLLVGTITGPIIILASSLPGRGGGTGNWIKGLVANALVFPAVFAAFLFAGIIFAMKPENWNSTPPLFGGLSTSILPTLLAYGVIFATPAIPDAVRGMFGIKPQQGGMVGAALGGFMGGIAVLKRGGEVGTGRFKEQAETYGKLRANERATGTLPTGGTAPYKNWYRLFGK